MSGSDRAVRLYRRSDRRMTQALRVLRGAFDGVWLGVLSGEQLSRLDELYYDREPQYHDEAYNRGGLFSWEQSVVDRHFTGVRRIVVTSAGAGRETLALAKAGYRAYGFEPHEKLVRFGRRLLEEDGLDATLSPSARNRFPDDAPDADAVVVGWGGYMLISDRNRRVALLRDAARALAPGAPVLLSFFTVNRIDLRLRTTARVGNALRRLRGREPAPAGDALVPTYVHYFTRDQVEAEMTEAGLEMVDFGNEDYGWAVGRVREKHGAASAREDPDD